jgi:hypothetical protein
MVSMIVPVMCGTPLVGYRVVVVALICTHNSNVRGGTQPAATASVALDECPQLADFVCKSRLRHAANRDSAALTRISARSIHHGPSEE